ncbi:DUF4097 family beta strand repeat-containing protein [Cryobacterium sp. BB736]|uniref:DUF4097 family beta strand repeat-containing protein n=1 Tax=Cryobacterium sp. BB736 TaxID=2746963 RepID=UPI001876E093
MTSAGILASAAAVGLAGCFILPQSTMSDDTVITDQVNSVRLAIDNDSGSVVITGTEGASEVTMKRTFSYRGNEPDEDTYSVDSGELVLEGCGRNCSVEYVIELAEDVSVEGETSNGRIELSHVADVDVRTSNGRVELNDVTGTVSARTSNGRISGEGLQGDTSVETSNGAIELELETAQNVSATTSNGSISLTVPEDSYDVTAETSNGSANIGVPDEDGGQFQLELRTSNGSIDVRER